MVFFSQVLQYVLSGITVGGIYAIIAIGFVTIYSVTGIINFAQGEFVMLGGMLAVSFYRMHMPMPLAFVLAVAIVTLLGAALERLAIHPARNAAAVSLIIITIGASIAIRGIALVIWGTDPLPLPAFSSENSVFVFGASLRPQAFWVLATMLVVVAGLYVFFQFTLMGKALRACAINRSAARLMGISAGTMSLLCFALSAGLGAMAGIVIAPITAASYDAGTMLGLKGFVAAVVGGMTSMPGAVAGGLVLGVMESLGAGLLSSGYKDAIAFVILLAVLIWRPGGLFGAPVAKGRL